MDIYITRAELRLPPYSVSADTDATYLEVLQEITKTTVDNLCKQEFSQEGAVDSYVEKKISGTGKDTIFMPKRLVTLEKVRIYSSSTGYIDYEVGNFNVEKKFITWNNFSDIQGSARLSVYDFPKGNYNIGVFGVWGWEEVPKPIKYLQGRLIQKILEDGSFANKFKSEKAGDFSYMIADQDAKILGDMELDRIIKQYKEPLTYAVV